MTRGLESWFRAKKKQTTQPHYCLDYEHNWHVDIAVRSLYSICSDHCRAFDNGSAREGKYSHKEARDISAFVSRWNDACSILMLYATVVSQDKVCSSY
jgi:hypothetical protein